MGCSGSLVLQYIIVVGSHHRFNSSNEIICTSTKRTLEHERALLYDDMNHLIPLLYDRLILHLVYMLRYKQVLNTNFKVLKYLL